MLGSDAGPLGALLFVAVLVVLALLFGTACRFDRQGGSAGASRDLDGLDDVGGAEGPDRGPPQYEDFASALRSYVLPMREAHPDWERLDGAVGIAGRAAFRFRRDGIRFEVNGDKVFAPLLAAAEWIGAHPGDDPIEL